MTAMGSVSPKSTHKVTLGFVQSLTSSSREVVYHELNQQHVPYKFREYHAIPYPMKDGSGIPWYQDKDTNIKKFKDSAGGQFTIAVEDEPRFAYPLRRNNVVLTPRTVQFHDTFITCLAAQVGQDLFYLHEIKWSLWIAFGDGREPDGPAGIKVLNEKPNHLYTKPVGMNLETEPANTEVLTSFD